MISDFQTVDAAEAEANEIADTLLSYCKLDTLAMVEIYRFLRTFGE